MVIGKTNLDQFATGLVGTRSPYGASPNAFDAAYHLGRLELGLGVAVARGLVQLRARHRHRGLGPRARGAQQHRRAQADAAALLSTRGRRARLPLARLRVGLRAHRRRRARGRTRRGRRGCRRPRTRGAPRRRGVAPDTRAHPRFGIPARPEFFGDRRSEAAWQAALAGDRRALGATCVPIDFGVLDEVAALLYEGPWVAERYAAVEDIAAHRPEAMHPVVREIIDARAGASRRPTRSRRCTVSPRSSGDADALMAGVDALLVPTAPTHLRTADVRGRSRSG